MEDRELLELAAKAAGYDVVWNPDWNCFQHRFPLPDAHGYMRHPWLPLDDDGDALRLAVKLGLRVNIGTIATAISWDPKDRTNLNEQHGSTDPFAATRRAIVRAAAEIGRQV